VINWTFHAEDSRKTFRLFRLLRHGVPSHFNWTPHTARACVSYANYWVTGSHCATQTEYRKPFSGRNVPADSAQSIDK